MAVKLRLRRTGARNQPRYRIIVADSRSPRDGRFIEIIGYYDPTCHPHEVAINEGRALEWLRRGAQPSDTVGDLLVRQGIMAKFYQAQGKPVPPQAVPRPVEGPAEAPPPAAEPEEPAQPGAEQETPAAAPEQPAQEPPPGPEEASAREQPEPERAEPSGEARPAT